MIPSITIPPSARDAAKETTEEVMKALDSKMRAFQSLYSQVSCTDLLAIKQQVADCVPLRGGMGGDVALDWRSDPFLSNSDLTLNVYDGSGGGNGGPTPYYAHTMLLAHGGRKSCLVEEQIRSQRRRAGAGGGRGYGVHRQDSSVSVGSMGIGGNVANADYKVDVHVPPLAARHVPQFLDYVYGSSLRLTTSNAAPLRYLSNRFDCRGLHREVTSIFIPRDLTLTTAPRYASMADELCDYELRDKAVRYMAERFDDININALRYMVPRLMRRVLQCERLACRDCERLSEIVAEYIRLMDRGLSSSCDGTDHPAVTMINDGVGECGGRERPPSSSSSSSLTDEDFYWLTHCQVMPRISPREALFYYAHGARYTRVMGEIGSGSLKSRCLVACADANVIHGLASHVDRAGVDANDPSLDFYDDIDVGMKVELLEHMMVAARRRIAEGDAKYALREEMDREARLSDEIMYKSNDMISTSSIDEISKAVVLGCGVVPANGIYLSIDARKCHRPGGNRHVRRVEDGGIDVVYERKAVWLGRPVAFVLYPMTSGQFYVQYKLGVRPRDDDDQRADLSTTRVLYNSPKIVVTDASSRVDRDVAVIIPEHSWELEDDDDSFGVGGLHPPPQFVGRLERPMTSRLNNSLMDSPSPERGGWVT
jgi:hypothetical protein